MYRYFTTHIASLLIAPSHTRTKCKINGDKIWPNLQRFINQFMKVGGIKPWKELMIGVQQLVWLLFNIDFINPGLVI